jgi:SAM-dependent methyltransferase
VTDVSVSRPFDKYERFGAYHWREIENSPSRHNAVLAGRYQVLLAALDPAVQRVLDIGCGDGTLTFKLSARAKRVCGIDDSLLPLRLAREQFHRRPSGHYPQLARADARRLPFQDDSFDCVVLADVIEHIDAPVVVMEEALRVLRHGGQILVTTPRRSDQEGAHEYHCREYTGVELRDLLRERFSAVDVKTFRPVGRSRLYERKILGRKLFRIAMNCCSALGWNPLAKSGSLADESGYADLCASGRKA